MRRVIKEVIEKVGHLFGKRKEVPSLLDRIREMEQQLDHSECQSVTFEQSPSSQFDLAALAEGAKILVDKAQSLVTKKELPQINTFLQKTLAIQYRLEAVNGGTDPLSVQPTMVNMLKGLVKEWKENQELIEDKDLTENDMYQIQVASQYPEFATLLCQDEELRGKFFLWTIRDHNEARVFIEYPALTEKIASSNLSGRIGRINGNDLKIQKVADNDGVVHKIVTLPFEGVDHNILDGDQVIDFRGGYQLTVNEVFKVFANKDYEVGNLEYLALGITNWNCHRWGFWNAQTNDFEVINLNHHQWWQQLPTFEVISKASAEERYKKILDGKVWVVAATATRGSATLDFENTHAFLELAVPFGDGRYAIYDFGKFAKRFPASFFEGLSIFCHNLHATVAYPDENVFYSHRQATFNAFTVDEDQGKAILELIKEDMKKGMEDNFVYQIESDNCAKWVHETLEGVLGQENVPDMFRMHLLDTEPTGPVAFIFRSIKKLPKCMQTRVMTFCHLFLGAAKQTWILEKGQYVCKSLTRHEFWETGIVYLPAFLHKKLENNAFESIKVLSDEIVETVYAFVKKLASLVLNLVKPSLRQITRYYPSDPKVVHWHDCC